MTEKCVRVKVPATSANLGPGFDSLGMALGLYSEFALTLREETGLTFDLRGMGAESIAEDEHNIVWQAVKYLLERTGEQNKYRGAHIGLINKIPLSRGMGSSATAIVGGLKAANAFLGNPYGKRELVQMATNLEGHPDNVAPAILGGVTVSIVEHGRVQSLSFWPKIRLQMVVAVPDFQLSTRLARQALPENVPLKDAIFNIGHASLLVAALCRGNETCLRHAFADTLHQPYRARLIPGLTEVIQAAQKAGALGASLSGAGPSVIAFTAERSHIASRVAAVMQQNFAAQGVTAKTMILPLDTKGAQVI